MINNIKKPELMSPAGDITSLVAALEAGADAVYFGIADINMRASARNFSVEDLVEISQTCKKFGAKAYLALNTIIYDAEIEKAQNIIKLAKEAGIDAVICWDFSIISLALEEKMPIFVSTQMSVANSQALLFLYKTFGIKRFVLARECTLEEIIHIKKEIKAALGDKAKEIELEVFIHGAMCVSVSGRCFMSQFAFNASANRGECRQPCRREFEIREIRDGKEFLIGKDYVMSPKDLCAMPFLDKVLDAGVESLKIEGRGRSPEYVKIVTECYREFIDFYYENKGNDGFLQALEELKIKLMERLNSVFHRGFSDGFFFGRQIEDWSGGNGSKASHRKVQIGLVTNFFRKVGVAEIKIQNRGFSVDEELLFIGKTTGVKELKVVSIEKDAKPVLSAEKNEVVGVKLLEIVREGDEVFKLVPIEEVAEVKQ
jgi:putative protease